MRRDCRARPPDRRPTRRARPSTARWCRRATSDARRQLLEGRAFATTDTPDTRAVAIVSESFARKYWPGAQRHRADRVRADARERQLVRDRRRRRRSQLQRQVGERRAAAIFFAVDAAAVRLQRRRRPHRRRRPRARGTDASDAAGRSSPNLLLLESQTMREQMQTMLLPVTRRGDAGDGVQRPRPAARRRSGSTASSRFPWRGARARSASGWRSARRRGW